MKTNSTLERHSHIPTDPALIAAVRRGERLPKLLEGLPRSSLLQQFRKAGARMPAQPEPGDFHTHLHLVRARVEQDDGAFDLICAWAAVRLPAFYSAPGTHDLLGWSGALLCRMGAASLGVSPPPATLRRAADSVIAGESPVQTATQTRQWIRWFGLQDIASQVEALRWRLDRSLAEMIRAAAGIAGDPDAEPLARWRHFDTEFEQLSARRGQLADTVEVALERIGSLCTRLAFPVDPRSVSLAALAEQIRNALELLGRDPDTARARVLTNLGARLSPPPPERDRSLLDREAVALENALRADGPVMIDAAAPILGILGRWVLDGIPPRPDERVRLEETLSARFCQRLDCELSVQASHAESAPVSMSQPLARRQLGDGRPSPLSMKQEHSLDASRSGIDVLIGSPALGLDRLWPALQSLHLNDTAERCWLLNAERGAHITIDHIREARRKGTAQVLRPVIQRTGMPLADYGLLIQLAIDWTQHLQARDGVVRPAFLVGPDELLSLRRSGVFEQLEAHPQVRLYRLRRWTAKELSSWLDQHQRGSPMGHAATLIAKTGGWPRRLRPSIGSGPVSEDTSYLGDVGLSSHPAAARIFELIGMQADTANMDTLQRVASKIGLRPDLIPMLVAYLVDLQLVIEDAGCLHAEPIAVNLS